MRVMLVLAGMMLASPVAVGADKPGIAIIRPTPHQTIHDNRGTVHVVVSLQGVEMSAGGHLRVLLDGKPHGAQHRSLSFSVEQVNRGEHTLQVMLLDNSNTVLVQSPITTFYLWQASSLFPKP